MSFGNGPTLAAHILALQRTIGNRAVIQMLGAMTRQESQQASATEATELREPPGMEAASAPPQEVPDEEAKHAAVPVSHPADDSRSSRSPALAHLEHKTVQHGDTERSEHVPEQQAWPKGPSYRRVLAALMKGGPPIVLVAAVLAAVFEPEPLVRLTLVSLSAGMVAVILHRFRRS